MRKRVIVVTLFVCLSVSLSVADFEYGGLLTLPKRHQLKWDDDLVPLICHFFEIRLVLEKKRKNSSAQAHLRPHPLFYKW